MTHSFQNQQKSEDQEFRLSQQLQSRLSYGLESQDLENTVQDLIKSYLIQKGGSSIRLPEAKQIDLNPGWYSTRLHSFLSAAIRSKEADLFFEWNHFLSKNGRFLPANVLTGLMEWASKDLAFARLIISGLGPLGQQLAALFPEFGILSEIKHEHAFQFKKSDQLQFAFQTFRERHPEGAFNYFLQRQQELKETDKLKCIDALKNKLNQTEWKYLSELNFKKNSSLQMEIQNMERLVNPSKFEQDKFLFNRYLSENRMDEYLVLSNQKIQSLIRQILSDFFETKASFEFFFNWLVSTDAVNLFLDTLQSNPSAKLASWTFDYLLKNQLLKENINLACLSHSMDHVLFNQSCLQWIEVESDQMDLEAFLHFIRPEKLFWSDELLIQLLELRNHKNLQRKYDFTVFWQMLPYKINPNSTKIEMIPDECKTYMSHQLKFDTIIQFRRGIRK